jgi:hypothetical protein
MRRREFIGLLGATLLAPVTTHAQETGRTYRLGIMFGAWR